MVNAVVMNAGIVSIMQEEKSPQLNIHTSVTYRFVFVFGILEMSSRGVNPIDVN